MEENREKPIDLYVYSLREGQIASRVAIGYGDLEILRMYKHLLRKPIVVILHDMIVTAVKCQENHHDSNIKEMEERLRTQQDIIMRYIGKFGRVRPL